MVTIYFDPIEDRKKGYDETLVAARSPRPVGTVHPMWIPWLPAGIAKKMISLAMGLVAQDRRQPKIELGL